MDNIYVKYESLLNLIDAHLSQSCGAEHYAYSVIKNGLKDILHVDAKEPANIKFVLNGCDISFTAEAPEDITLKQLLKQCDKIKPDWCACGICSYERAGFNETCEPEIIISYDDIRKSSDDVSCRIISE